MIRRGAQLVHAFAAARVPKLTVVLRKSYGGAYITMNSRDLGADLVLAWPDAELGIMSARAAVGIVNRRELRVAGDPEAERARLADAYADEHLRADAAAAAGFVDEIIAPAETRERLSLGAAARWPDAGRDPGRQTAADHRRHHQGLDRLPRRRAGAAPGGERAADELRPGSAVDRARGAAAARAGRGAGARRQCGGRSGRADEHLGRALGRGGRRAARDRVCARGRAGRPLHDHAGRAAPGRPSRPARSPSRRWRRRCSR